MIMFPDSQLVKPQSLKHESDIDFYDGPLSSIFRDESENPWIYAWADQSNESATPHCRWIVFSVTDKQLNDATKDNQIDILLLYPKSGEVYIRDTDNKGQTIRCWKIDISDVPESYLPPSYVIVNVLDKKFYSAMNPGENHRWDTNLEKAYFFIEEEATRISHSLKNTAVMSEDGAIAWIVLNS